MSSKADTKNMNQEKKHELKPKLRFPEFWDAGEWEEDKLGDLSKILRGGSPRPIENFLTTDIDGLNWLKIGDVDKNSKYVTHTQERVRPDALSKTREVNPGDLILSNSMSFGRPYILKIKSCIHDGWIAVTEIDRQIDRDYLYYLMTSPTSQIYFLNNAAGSGVQNLNADIIKLLPILFPNYLEQQKIADCLSSIDDRITLETQKLDTLKAHKKGLMQQLFPAEGETLPKLRFPEFHDSGEWEETSVGQISANVIAGGTPSTLEKEYWNGSIRWMNSGELNYKKVCEVQGRITEKGLQNSSTKLIPKHCILIGLAGQGKTRGTVAMNMVELCTNQSIAAIFPNEKLFNSNFLYQNLDNRYDELRRISAGGEGRGGLNLQIIKSLKVNLPSPPEQQKIADCLTSIDEAIAAQIQAISTLKTHKKGLMQQLFPSVDEVTG
jgi:type I restriction enzyme S subunit